MTVPTAVVAPRADLRTTLLRRGTVGAEQAVVLGAQLVAGVGNLAFAVVAARRLSPDGFASVAAFLALYLLAHLPAGAVAAAGALAPRRAARQRPTMLAAGIAAAILLAVGARPLADLLGQPTGFVLGFAAALPGAALLGFERGRLYALGRPGAVATSLVAEPVVRLLVGIVLLEAFGTIGAAVGVVMAGYATLLLSRRLAERLDPRFAPGPIAGPQPAAPAAVKATAVAFLVLAVVQSQDLVVARAVLGDGAADFAALSTLGGAAAFATATVPLVLLGAAGRREQSNGPPEGAFGAAVAATVAIGLGAVAIAIAAPNQLLVAVLGPDHAAVGHLLGAYLLAMAALALARVVAARRCADGEGRAVAVTVAAFATIQLVALLAVPARPSAFVVTTLATTTALTASLSLPVIARNPAVVARRREVALVAACAATGLLVRLVATRGLWVDEAISIRQARLGFGEMIADLRGTDVHPPLHHVVLWLTVRLFGAGELAVRLPSLVAGTMLVPAVHLLARVLYDRRTALLTSAVTAVAPFLVWYSQEARMYALLMLAGVLSVLGQALALRDGRRRYWLLYAVATAAMVWTQYFAVLVVAVQQTVFAAALWSRRHDADARQVLARWAAAVAAIVVLVLPLVPLLADQLHAYGGRHGQPNPTSAGPVAGTPGDGVSLYAAVANGVWAIWGYHADRTMAQIAALWPLGMLASLLALGRRPARSTGAIAALAVVPMVVLFVVGTVKRDVFELRYACTAVPLAVLLAARAVTALAPSRRALSIAGTALVLTMVAGLVDQQLNGANPRRYDFDGALAEIESRAGPEDIVLYEPVYLADVVAYYAPDLEARPLSSIGSLGDAGRVFVVTTERVTDSRASAARVGDALARLEQDGRAEIDRFTTPNVAVWELQ